MMKNVASSLQKSQVNMPETTMVLGILDSFGMASLRGHLLQCGPLSGGARSGYRLLAASAFGSGHWVVYCFLDLPKHAKQQVNKTTKRKFKTKKHSKPSLDENVTAVLYHNILNQTLKQQKPTT